MDTSVKVAFEYGYKLIIPEGAVTTFDGDDIPAETINEFYEDIWEDRFADVLDYKNIFLKRGLNERKRITRTSRESGDEKRAGGYPRHLMYKI